MGGRLSEHSSRVTARTVQPCSTPGDVEQVMPLMDGSVLETGKRKTPGNHSLTISHDKNLPVLFFSVLGVLHQGLVLSAGRAGGAANPQHRA